jgi:hypothetical protein
MHSVRSRSGVCRSGYRAVATCISELQAGERREIVIDMDVAGDRESAEPKPEFYYAERAQQTEFNCAKCGGYNDVRGRFAYCGSCGWRNNRESLRQAHQVHARLWAIKAVGYLQT